MTYGKRSWRVRLEFKLEDFWVGVFWRGTRMPEMTDVWVCLIPCLPIHITTWVSCPVCGCTTLVTNKRICTSCAILGNEKA